jgi:hypothetical protein
MLEKMKREDAKLLEMVFSYFIKKLRMEKSDSKLLEML